MKLQFFEFTIKKTYHFKLQQFDSIFTLSFLGFFYKQIIVSWYFCMKMITQKNITKIRYFDEIQCFGKHSGQPIEFKTCTTFHHMHFFVCFCCFTSHVNSYGHCWTVSSLNHTFSWAGLSKRLTSNLCTYFRL